MKLNKTSGIDKLSCVEIQIVKLLKVSDNLDQKAITKSLSNINKSNISRSLKKLYDKDVIRKQHNGTYQYRYGNQYSFKNPDKVLNDLLNKLYYMPIDYSIDEGIDRVSLEDNWTSDQISHWREEKKKIGVTEDNLDKYIEEREKDIREMEKWESPKEIPIENITIIDNSELLKKLKGLKDK